MQSHLRVGVIMDGNGRWAAARGLPRLAGHRAGGDALCRVVEAAPDLGIGTLTMYAFSSDNWRRPATEVAGLFALFEEHLEKETPRALAQGVRFSLLGRRDRLPPHLRRAVARAERATAAGKRLLVRLAIDYSARDEILRAAAAVAARGTPTRKALAEALAGSTAAAEADLVVRTGGEQRLSDFMLWESAYAELYFTPVAWPDFDAEDLAAAVAEFHRRQRRFGGLPAPVEQTRIAAHKEEHHVGA